jgi:AcrR family transcriptional regulator
MTRDVVPARRRLTRAESKARTRQQLLDAAAELVARRGVNATSVEEIAETAGYSIGAVYSNFSGKEELLVALLDEHLTAGAQELVRRLDQAGADRQTRADAAGRYFDEVAAGRQAWFLLSAELWLYAVRNPALRRAAVAARRGARGGPPAASLPAGPVRRSMRCSTLSSRPSSWRGRNACSI